MFARLQYNTSFTAAGIYGDVVAVLTGTTNIASLSAGLNSGNSYINTSWCNGGWTTHDTQATYTVLKSPFVDDAATYKYIQISNNLTWKLFESWNATTHAGTNSAGNGTVTAIFAAGTPGTDTPTVFISSSERHVCFNSFRTPTTPAYSGMSGAFEHTRVAPWQGVGKSYLPVVAINGSLNYTASHGTLESPGSTSVYPFFYPRVMSASGGALTGSSAYTSTLVPQGVAWYTGGAQPLMNLLGSSGPTMRYRNSSLAASHNLIPFGVCNPSLCVSGQISSLADIYFTTRNYGNATDTLTVDSKDYMVLPWMSPGPTTITGALPSWTVAIRIG